MWPRSRVSLHVHPRRAERLIVFSGEADKCRTELAEEKVSHTPSQQGFVSYSTASHPGSSTRWTAYVLRLPPRPKHRVRLDVP